MSDPTIVMAVVLATFLSALGMGCLPLWRKLSDELRMLQWMTGLAAGFLLASAILIAIPEGFMIYDEGGGVDFDAIPASGLAVLLGFLLLLVLETFGFGHDIHEEHHEHAHEHGHGHVNHPSGVATSAVVGLTIHAAADGLAIGAALAADELHITLPILLGVLMHKLPAAFSLGAFSQHERNDRKRSLIDILVFSAATPLFIIITWSLLGDVSEAWIGLAILFSAGSFLYVATVDVLPEVHRHGSAKEVCLKVMIGALAIIAVMLFMDVAGLVEHAH